MCPGCARNCNPAGSRSAPYAAWVTASMRLSRKWFPDSLHGRLLAVLMPALGALLAFNLWSDFRAAGEYTREPYDQALADTAVALAAHVQSHGQVLSLDLS